MNKKRCNTLLPLVQLLPAVAAAATVLFALPRTVPVLAAVPERLTAVVEQPAEAASSEAEEEALPKLPYADGVYVGSSRGYGGAVRVQVTMENGSITEVEVLDGTAVAPGRADVYAVGIGQLGQGFFLRFGESGFHRLLHHGCQFFRHGSQHRHGAGQGKKHGCRCRHRWEQLHQRQQCVASFFVHSNSS